MAVAKVTPKNIDAYIASFPEDVQEILEKIRLAVHSAAPEAEETIKYGMPTFALKGSLVHFAAFKNHIGFFPPPYGDEPFNQELAPYRGEKGSLKFPLDQPIPLDLISRIVAVRVKENQEKAEARARQKNK